MKLYPNQLIKISSAAGKYEAIVQSVEMAYAADSKLYEWYTTKTLSEFSSTGERLAKTGYFNENMANQLVIEVEGMLTETGKRRAA